MPATAQSYKTGLNQSLGHTCMYPTLLLATYFLKQLLADEPLAPLTVAACAGGAPDSLAPSMKPSVMPGERMTDRRRRTSAEAPAEAEAGDDMLDGFVSLRCSAGPLELLLAAGRDMWWMCL
jgi:hypothetical protein